MDNTPLVITEQHIYTYRCTYVTNCVYLRLTISNKLFGFLQSNLQHCHTFDMKLAY